MLLFVFFALANASPFVSYTCTGVLFAWPSNEPIEFTHINNEEESWTYFKTDYFTIYATNYNSTLCRKDNSCESFYYDASELYYHVDSCGNVYTFDKHTNAYSQITYVRDGIPTRSETLDMRYPMTLSYKNCTTGSSLPS